MNIEDKRKKLYTAISQKKSLTDKIILRISNELDELVNKEQLEMIKRTN